jgi:hypothetical protein
MGSYEENNHPLNYESNNNAEYSDNIGRIQKEESAP